MMVSFEQFLCESTFSKESWETNRHNYAHDVIVDLLAGKKIKLTLEGPKDNKVPITVDGRNYVTIDDFDKQTIEKISKAPKSFSHHDFNDAFKRKIDGKTSKNIWSFLEKSVYSKSTKGADTNGEELAVCVCVDALTHGIKDLDNFDFSDYECSNMITDVVNARYVELAKQTLTNPDWRSAVIKTAKHIVKTFPMIGSYYCQYHTAVYDSLRKNAVNALKRSSYKGLTEDKWNPADVIYTKKPTIQVPKTLIIADYNNWFNQQDFIAISLKKSDKDALHGSVSLGNIIKNQKLISTPKGGNDVLELADIDLSGALKSYSTVNQALPDIKKALQVLSSSPIAKLISIGGAKKGITDKFFDFVKRGSATKQELDQYTKETKFAAESFLKSTPQTLNFLASISKLGITKVIDLIQTIYLIAASSANFSSKYYKASADYCKPIIQGSTHVVVNDILIPIDGTAKVIFNVNVNGNNFKLDARSKSSKTQFMIIHNSVSKSNYQPIKNFINDFK